MNDMEEKLMALEGNWYGRLGDIASELNEMGLDLDGCSYISREYIGVQFEDEDGDDYEAILRLGGTETTVTVTAVEINEI